MNTKEPAHDDKALHQLLQQWRADSPLPPHFQEGVWRRIERFKAPTAPLIWGFLADWIGRLLRRPALAVSYLAILLAVGATTGWTQARQETARVKGELGERYLRILDPYQAPRQ